MWGSASSERLCSTSRVGLVKWKGSDSMRAAGVVSVTDFCTDDKRAIR